MTDHPQTATERFLRHGVAGGFDIAASLLDDDPLPHQEPCNCRDCSLTDAKGTE